MACGSWLSTSSIGSLDQNFPAPTHLGHVKRFWGLMIPALLMASTSLSSVAFGQTPKETFGLKESPVIPPQIQGAASSNPKTSKYSSILGVGRPWPTIKLFEIQLCPTARIKSSSSSTRLTLKTLGPAAAADCWSLSPPRDWFGGSSVAAPASNGPCVSIHVIEKAIYILDYFGVSGFIIPKYLWKANIFTPPTWWLCNSSSWPVPWSSGVALQSALRFVEAEVQHPEPHSWWVHPQPGYTVASCQPIFWDIGILLLHI